MHPKKSILSLMIALMPVFPATLWAADPGVTLVDELRVLAERARNQRAADRWLQEAMEELVVRYSKPVAQELLFDDFRDGDYTRNPQWQVVSGSFRVGREGLFCVVDANAAAQGATSSQQDASPEAAVAGLLVGMLLGPPKDSQQTQQSGTTATPLGAPGDPAKIVLQSQVPNAFIIEARLTVRELSQEARIDIGLFQEATERYGYRLRMKSGPRGYVELERIRNQRSSIVESLDVADLFANKQAHDLRWQQSSDGTVSVFMDDQKLFEVRDKAFNDNYQQLGITNHSGDLTVHQVRISG